ncbi:PorT family protein [Pontibacter sp. 172403-2]|uniref:outer membrane beta-barrel protein n=1 Tax=Pontibacter rufus TaxID=2791028 RepID=UPI0018AFF0B2|nr:outer membrane beta-barrel protein [Pontibacter sp. 172403-2]MBF9251848.1 PorT family protein [Pontibacter sp. 172403-2]
MSSAANDKREQLEEEFRRRMHDAEATPSADLWARIDHTLTMQENSVYKSRMVLYRQLAAACFVLFVLAGALFMYQFSKDTNQGSLATTGQLPTAAAPETTKAAPEALAAAATKIPAAQVPGEAMPQAAAAGSTRKNNATAPVLASVPSVSAAGVGARTANASQPADKAYTYMAGLPENAAQSGSITAGIARSLTDSKLRLSAGEAGRHRTAFASLQPFYQTARQSIAATPFLQGSHHTSRAPLGAQQLLRNPVAGLVAANVIQEPGTTSSTEGAAYKQQQELALVLNGKKESESSSDSRWTVGMAYAPSYFEQNIGMPDPMAGTASMFSLAAGAPAISTFDAQQKEKKQEEYADNTDPGFSFSFDARLGFKLAKRLKLLTGVGYAQNTARTKSNYIIRPLLGEPQRSERVVLEPATAFLPTFSNGFSPDSMSIASTDVYNVQYRYRHLTLPVGLQYEGRLSKDWYWYAGSGVAANFLIQSTIMASNDEVSDVNFNSGDDSPFRKVQLSGNVSMGVGKRLSNAVSVSVGPEFRGYFNTLLAEPDNALAPQGKPYTIGLNMALNYDLGSSR